MWELTPKEVVVQDAICDLKKLLCGGELLIADIILERCHNGIFVRWGGCFRYYLFPFHDECIYNNIFQYIPKSQSFLMQNRLACSMLSQRVIFSPVSASSTNQSTFSNCIFLPGFFQESLYLTYCPSLSWSGFTMTCFLQSWRCSSYSMTS